MKQHESQHDYNLRTALFIKNVIKYSELVDCGERMDLVKSSITFALNTYLHMKKIPISTAFYLESTISSMLSEDDISLNSNEFIQVLELYNSEDNLNSFMFYPDLSKPKSLMHHSFIHYMYFNDLAKEDEHQEDYLFASETHYQMAKNILNNAPNISCKERVLEFLKTI